MSRIQQFLPPLPTAHDRVEILTISEDAAMHSDECSWKSLWGHAWGHQIRPIANVVVRHVHEHVHAISERTQTVEQAALELRITTLERQLRLMQAELSRRSTIVPIATLQQNDLEVYRPIMAVVQEEDGVFVASFFDANVNESGESQLEATEMLKAAIASTFRFLSSNESRLGTDPARQLSALHEFIRFK